MAQYKITQKIHVWLIYTLRFKIKHLYLILRQGIRY
jgi:hypothetical protein